MTIGHCFISASPLIPERHFNFRNLVSIWDKFCCYFEPILEAGLPKFELRLQVHASGFTVLVLTFSGQRPPQVHNVVKGCGNLGVSEYWDFIILGTSGSFERRKIELLSLED